MIEKIFSAKWITDDTYKVPFIKSPTPMNFRALYKAKGKIKNAVCYATALGVYDLFVNGKRVGDAYFAPGFTSYYHQLQYQKYDLTALLSEENEITAVVGGGWAVGRFTYLPINKISASRQAFLFEMEVEYEDGTVDRLITDEKWQVTENGKLSYADWYNGVVYDATKITAESDYKKATVTSPRKHPKLYEQYGEQVIAHETLVPTLHHITPSGELIYDFGQNFAGVIDFTVDAKEGQRIVFRHAEVLMDGELFVRSLRSAKATVDYTAVNGVQRYSPTLTYMGFRYVGVRGISAEALTLTARVLHSDVKEIGGFECSNPLITGLQRNIRWSGKSNFVDIPTDCPQRDERLGWTGDISVFAQTACFNFNMSKFLAKWLLDMKSEQNRGGGLPVVIPRQGLFVQPVFATSCWGDSCILVPWAEYMARGDAEILKLMYPTMKKYLKAAKWWAELFSFRKTDRRIWKLPFHYGDWCAPNEKASQWLKKGKWVATAYWANSCKIIAKIAEILGFEEDKLYYLALFAEIRDAYLKRFTDGKGNLKKEFQTAYVLPLYFGLVEGEIKRKMAENLARLVKESNYHLTTGFTGTPYLLFALSDNGYADVAYKVLLQENCPSWLYEVKAGGTTIWERWDALRPDGTVNLGDFAGSKENKSGGGGMVSFNHYANGAVGDWFYRRIVGIEPTECGYKRFSVKPVVGGGLTYAKAFTETPYGKIEVRWEIKSDIFSMDVTVPDGTEAEITTPDGKKTTVGQGRHTFQSQLD